MSTLETIGVVLGTIIGAGTVVSWALAVVAKLTRVETKLDAVLDDGRELGTEVATIEKRLDQVEKEVHVLRECRA